MSIQTIIYISFLTIFYTVGFAQENCSLRKNQEGIKVHLCETEGSLFKTIKVSFEAKGSIKSYASGVLHIENYKSWQGSINHVKTLKQISGTELIYYAEIDAPWPIEQRDLIFHLKVTQNQLSKVLTVTLKEMPTYIPEKEGIIRIPSAESTLTVSPITKNHLKVEYILHVNPGGGIPAFIANMFAANSPWNTFKNFRQKLENGEFKIDYSLPIANY